MTTERSGFLKLNARDLFRSALIVAGTSLVYSLAGSLQAGALPGLSDLQHIVIVALSAGMAYLAKNWTTNEKGQTIIEKALPGANV